MEQELNIYPHREEAYDKETALLEASNITDRNKELIRDYHNYLFSKGSGNQRVAKLGSQLRRICMTLPCNLDEVKRKEIQDTIAIINRQDKLSPDTKADYRRGIKQFYKWFKDLDKRLETGSPESIKEVNQFYKYLETEVSRACPLKQVDYSNIISDKEVNEVLDKGCLTIREKALIKVLHETGFRAGELLTIKLKDIQIMQNRALIRVFGKTGERQVPVVHSLPYLVQLLDVHPFKHDRDSYLWIGDSNLHPLWPLRHIGGQKLINRCFERAGMSKKRHNFHWFRHSRATLLASHLTEQLLCKYMGWSLGSRQVRRYCHLCVKQLEDAILTMNGMETEKKEKAKEQPQTCACGTINTSQSRYCFKCGNPLSVNVVMQDQEMLKQETEDRLKVFAEIMADPVKRQQFEEFRRLFLGQKT